MNKIATVLLVLWLSLLFPSLALANDDQDCNGTRLEVNVTSVNSSVSGTAAICIGEDGVRGKLKADGLTVGHGYTVWFFYGEGMNVAPPGRFDSTVAEDDSATFRGHVGGLQVSSGATITLFVFHHPSLGPNNVTRAQNLLTPSGASPAAKAVFNIP